MSTLLAQMKQRRGTVAFWTSSNPIPLLGEICLVQVGEAVAGPGGTTWYKCKIGDGVTHWLGLPYANIGDGNALIAAFAAKVNTVDIGSAAAADVGDFEAAGAVAAHTVATDPHGDRAYADGIVAGATSTSNGYTDSAVSAEATARDAAIAASVVGIYRAAGDWNPSGGTWPTTGTGSGGAVRSGDTYISTAAGTIGTKTFDVGDSFYAIVNAPGQTNANWGRFDFNTDQAQVGVRGTLAVAAQATVENPATTNDTDAVTAKKWWQAFAIGISVAAFLAAVRGTVLTGLSLVSSAAVTATDSVLVAIGKLQAQVTALLVDPSNGHIEVAKNKSYTLIFYAYYACTINELKIKCTSGSVTAAVKINGTAVASISAVSVSTTLATATATGANTVAIGDLVELVLSANSSAKDVRFSLKKTRTL